MLYNPLSEQLVIGMMIANPEACVQGVSELTEDHFENPNNRYTFEAIHSLVERNEKVNVYSVKNALEAYGNPYSLEDILNIEDKFFLPEKWDSLISNLIDSKNRREAVKELQNSIHRIKTDDAPLESILSETQVISEAGKEASNYIRMSDYKEYREEVLKQRSTRVPVLCGVPAIDSTLTYKFGLGEISVIAARPQNMKSATKANFIVNQCRAGLGVVNFALEQSLEVESDRIDSIISGVSLTDIVNLHNIPKASPIYQKVSEAWDEQSKWNYHLFNAMGKTVFQLRPIIRRAVSEGCSVFYFDLFDRLPEVGGSAINKAQKTSAMLIKMLELASEFKIHLCLLVQLNREAVKQTKAKETQPNKPKISHLKDSGGYEEIARTILLLHYPKAHDHTLVSSNLEVIIAKQSNGPLKSVELAVEPNSLRLISNPIRSILGDVKTS